MVLAYDGSPFQGWQLQQHAPTVQGTLEQALQTVLRHPVRVTGSGRTDTGVHALNQVANFRLPVAHDLARLQQSLNGLAGPAIAVKALIPVPDAFHARHS
ncbi:MAG TPA: tRNA pseudouridine(38-40) synthase TruA, partial [bacterium]